jgi:hypothetical protein
MVAALQPATRTVPIVFVLVTEIQSLRALSMVSHDQAATSQDHEFRTWHQRQMAGIAQRGGASRDASSASNPKIAKRFNVSTATIFNWRRKLSI